MAFPKEMLNPLLILLEEKYPQVIVRHSDINVPDLDPKLLPALLQFCLDEGWITCKVVDTVDGQKYFDLIRITSKGIRYLRDF